MEQWRHARSLRAVVAGMGALVGLAACSDTKLGPNISDVNGIGIREIRVSPALDTLFIPDTVRTTDRIFLSATALARTGVPLGGMRFVWRSSDISVAVVDSSGNVRPVSPGTATISASAGKVGEATVVVVPATETVQISPAIDTVLANDPQVPARDTATFVARGVDRFGTPLTGVAFTWQSSTGNVASVDGKGIGKAGTTAGTAGITVRSNGHQATASLVVLNATQSVTVSPSLDTIFVDDPIVPATNTRTFTPQAKDPYGGVLTRAAFTWQSSAPSATVDAQGVAHAASLGNTTITVSSGGQQATATVRVVPLVASVQLSAPVTQVLAKDTLQLSATALNYSNAPISGRTFAFVSSNPNVATVNSSGRVIFVSAGTATFTATSGFRSNQVTVTASPRELLKIDAGGDYTCGLTALNRGYCWGANPSGQLAPGAGVVDSTCFNDAMIGGPPANYTQPPSPSPCHLPPMRMARTERSRSCPPAGRSRAASKAAAICIAGEREQPGSAEMARRPVEARLSWPR